MGALGLSGCKMSSGHPWQIFKWWHYDHLRWQGVKATSKANNPDDVVNLVPKPPWSGTAAIWPEHWQHLKMAIVTFETFIQRGWAFSPLFSASLAHSQCSLPRKIISWSFQPFCEPQSISLLFTMVWECAYRSLTFSKRSINSSCSLSIYVVIAPLFRVRWCESIHRLIWSSIRHLVWRTAIIQLQYKKKDQVMAEKGRRGCYLDKCIDLSIVYKSHVWITGFSVWIFLYS